MFMDKQDKIKILALVGVIVMFGSMVAPQMLGNLGSTTKASGTGMYGLAVINGTIRTYDPVLIASLDYNESSFDSVRDDEGFRELTQLPDGWLLETTTRDDVYPLAQMLREANVTTVTIANIALPGTVELMLENGSTIDAQSRGGIVRVIMEPFLEEDSQVSVQFVGLAYDNVLVNTTNAAILADELEEEVDAIVEKLNFISYSYSIPWSERNSLDTSNLTGYEFSITQNDIVYFSRSLTVDEVMRFRELSYVEYIDQYSAGVSPDFVDNESLEADFGEIGYELPDSTLRVLSNETLELPYDGVSMRSYSITLPQTAGIYALEDREFEIETDASYDAGDVIPVVVKGKAIGSTVVSIASVGTRPPG